MTTAVRRRVTVANPAGLHMRPAGVVAKHAQSFAAAVTVCNGDRKADGKSPMALILLIALPGTELVVEADGPDAESAADAVCAALGDPGDDAGPGSGGH